MKTKLKLLAFVSALAFAGLALIPAARTSAASVASVETSVLASPYSANCARCHGGDGRADTAKGRELDADDLTTGKVQGMSTAKMTRIIKNGKGDMPAFKNLSASQISSIIRTVKSF
jgi:mono/diheme cytochrome c family protein